MVAVRLARSAFRNFRVLCFWSFAADLHISAANAAWVAEQLRRNGNHAAWQAASRIQSLLVGSVGVAKSVDRAHDSSWRFLPPVFDPQFGFRLHPLDLAINKVLALAGRDDPREFLDVIYVHRNVLSLGCLCWAAAGRDPGISPTMLVEMLARKGRYRAEDFAGLDLTSQPDLADLKRTWLGAIATARLLTRDLPAGDAGCLYWNPTTNKFETPSGDVSRLVRHFGCQGGVLPLAGEGPTLADDSAKRRLLAERIAPIVAARSLRPHAKIPHRKAP